jgi:uncharacterized oligopeptide transporter (OPT) family protein
MKTLLAIVAVCVLALLASIVVGQEQRPLPLGVATANWIPIGDKVGFVVTRDAPNQEVGVLSGYFLAWHEDSWQRLDSAGGVRFQPIRK